MPDWIGTFQNGRVMTAQHGVNTALTRPGRVFPRPFTHGGGFVSPPPPIWGDKCKGTSVNGGIMRGDIDLMGGT